MSSFGIVPIATIHRLLAPVVEALLAPLGFEPQKPLHWVRSADAPVRQVFCLRQWKGGALAPAWGLSLDFVPHVSGSSIRWHRTMKSAQLDFTFDARDSALYLSYMGGPELLMRDAPAVIARAVAKATDLWEGARSESSLPHAIDQLRAHLASGGLGFYNYYQHPIAVAFVLARRGQADAARLEIDQAHFASPVVRDKMLALLSVRA